MLLLESILIAALSQTAPAIQSNGYLGGVVVRASDGQAVPEAEVVLSVRQGNEFIPAAKTVADEDGKFIFGELPVATHVIYKPGANWQGIHYPGPATRLTPSRSTVGVKLTVNEAVGEPNLLVARRHEMTLRPKPGVLEVSEVLLIDNPTMDCYVGKPSREGGEPETLCLNIPPEFEQVTFDKEFYGRRFALADGRLVTGIPWTPGRAELRFTYVVRNDRPRLTWTRRLDLPCNDVSVRIVMDKPEDVSCSLDANRRDEADTVVYQYSGAELAAGHEICVELGRLSVSPLAYGKWAAVSLLAILVISGTVWRRRPRSQAGGSSSNSATTFQDVPPNPKTRLSRTRGKRPRSVGTPECRGR